MYLIDIFRKNVKYYRFMKEYSQEKLGKLSGLSTHYISDIEQGKYSPSIPTIECIEKSLQIEPYLLFIANPKANQLSSRVDINKKYVTDFFKKINHIIFFSIFLNKLYIN